MSTHVAQCRAAEITRTHFIAGSVPIRLRVKRLAKLSYDGDVMGEEQIQLCTI